MPSGSSGTEIPSGTPLAKGGQGNRPSLGRTYAGKFPGILKMETENLPSLAKGDTENLAPFIKTAEPNSPPFVKGGAGGFGFGILAAALFVPLFIFRRLGPLDFWWWMSANIAVLVLAGAATDKGYVRSIAADVRSKTGRKIFFGGLSAAVLYGVFWVGNVASRALFAFAGGEIGAVYNFKAGASPVRILLLMALWIGPGEELFWRAFLQRRWQSRLGSVWGFLAATALYALVHVGSGNIMLVLAAAVCGLFWGALYLATGSFLLVAVSHTLWDLAVFVLFPFS